MEDNKKLYLYKFVNEEEEIYLTNEIKYEKDIFSTMYQHALKEAIEFCKKWYKGRIPNNKEIVSYLRSKYGFIQIELIAEEEVKHEM